MPAAAGPPCRSAAFSRLCASSRPRSSARRFSPSSPAFEAPNTFFSAARERLIVSTPAASDQAPSITMFATRSFPSSEAIRSPDAVRFDIASRRFPVYERGVHEHFFAGTSSGSNFTSEGRFITIAEVAFSR